MNFQLRRSWKLPSSPDPMPTLLPITLLFNFGIQAEETYAQEGIGVSEARGPRYTQRIHEDLDSLAYALKRPPASFSARKEPSYRAGA